MDNLAVNDDLKKLRLNKTCQLVLRALAASDGLQTARQIHSRLKENQPAGPGLTSVYRALDSLSGLGILQTVNLGDGEKRYEAVEAGHHHHHLICQSCHRSIHLDQCLVETLENAINAKHGFETRTHVLEIFGICKPCQNGIAQ